MADNTSGNSEELKLKITPELDQAALRKAQEQLDGLKAKPLDGTKSSGGSAMAQSIKADNAALKENIRLIKEQKDTQDVFLRKTRIAANEKIQLLRQEGAVGKITMEQMNASIIQQQQLIETTTNESIQKYQQLDATLQDLKLQYYDIPNALAAIAKAEASVMYARQRATTGFDSMSGSMQQMVSQTKNANLAFMNFGRIVQDAPFGLIGIANNIDPLLMSLSVLSNEIDINTQKVRGFSGSLKALGAQLLSPAGVIFLLGSALPSILLVLQRRQQEAAKESNAMADALKKVADEFGRLSSEAAGEQGIAQINKEFDTTSKTLDVVSGQLKEIEDEIERQVTLQIASNAIDGQKTISASEYRKQLEKSYGQTLINLRSDKQLLETNKQQLDAKRNQLGFEERMGVLQEEHGIAASLSLDQQIKKQKQLNDLRLEALEILDPIQAEIEKEQQRIIELITKTAQSATSATSAEASKTILELRKYYDGIEQMIRDKNKETGKEIKANDDRLFKSREELLDAFNRYVQTSLTNRVDDEKRALKEILDSEYTTQKERLAATQTANRNISLAIRDLEASAEKADEDFANKRLDKLKTQRQKELKIRNEQEEKFYANREFLADQEIITAELRGQTLLSIELRKQRALEALYQEYRERDLLNTQEYEDAKKAIKNNAEKESLEYRLETANIIANATIAIAEFMFGETKKTRSAQVIVDTLFGMQRAITENADNLVRGIALAALIGAKGATALRKINQTQRGSSSLNNNDSSAPTTREVAIQGVGTNMGQTINASQISQMAQPQNQMMMPEININANVDRRGLAIAVRDGEQEIRTQQFSYT